MQKDQKWRTGILLHGNGTNASCMSTHRKYIQAGRMTTGVNCVDAGSSKSNMISRGTYDLSTVHDRRMTLRLIDRSTINGTRNDAWIDDLIVRKYASPEPTWGTWGRRKPHSPPTRKPRTPAQAQSPQSSASPARTPVRARILGISTIHQCSGRRKAQTPAQAQTRPRLPQVTLPIPTDSGVGSEKSERFILFASRHHIRILPRRLSAHRVRRHGLAGRVPAVRETDDYLGDPLIQEGLLSHQFLYACCPCLCPRRPSPARCLRATWMTIITGFHVVPNYIDLGPDAPTRRTTSRSGTRTLCASDHDLGYRSQHGRHRPVRAGHDSPMSSRLEEVTTRRP